MVVHDGVRPFVTEALLQEVLVCAAEHGAALSAVPLRDTLKRVSSKGEVQSTVPRENLWRAQDPAGISTLPSGDGASTGPAAGPERHGRCRAA